MAAWWSYLLTAIGVFGLWLAGRKDPRGWMVGVAAQVLWIAYATATRQWGFYVSAIVYGAVYLKNARAWLKPSDKPELKCTCSWYSGPDPDCPHHGQCAYHGHPCYCGGRG